MNNIDELRKIIADLPHNEKWPDCNHIEGGKYSHRLPEVKSLALITTIIETEEKYQSSCLKWREAFDTMHTRAMKADATIIEQADKLEKLNRLIPFIEECLDAAFEGSQFDGSEIQGLLVDAGVVRVEQYNPEIHTDIIECCEDGDDFYIKENWFMALANKLRNQAEEV